MTSLWVGNQSRVAAGDFPEMQAVFLAVDNLRCFHQNKSKFVYWPGDLPAGQYKHG